MPFLGWSADDKFFAYLLGAPDKKVAICNGTAGDVPENRVFILGVSAGAGQAARLLEDRPDLWRGAILLSPVSFPDISRLKAARILIDSATGDEYLKRADGIALLTKFQDAVALAGIPVTLTINNGAGHVYRPKNSLPTLHENNHAIKPRLNFFKPRMDQCSSGPQISSTKHLETHNIWRDESSFLKRPKFESAGHARTGSLWPADFVGH